MIQRGLALGVFVLFWATNPAQCQKSETSMTPAMFKRIRENLARASLTRTVKFIVGNTATPSPAMIDFAVVAGSSTTPETKGDAYLNMLKDVARTTPEVAVNFMTNTTGSKRNATQIDEQKLDAYIIERAMRYVAASSAMRKRNDLQEQMQRQRLLKAMQMRRMHALKMASMAGRSGLNGASSGVSGISPSQEVTSGFLIDATTYIGGSNNDFGVKHHESPPGAPQQTLAPGKSVTALGFKHHANPIQQSANTFGLKYHNGASTNVAHKDHQEMLPPAIQVAQDGTISLSDIYRFIGQNTQAKAPTSTKSRRTSDPAPASQAQNTVPSSGKDAYNPNLDAMVLGSLIL